MVNHYLLDNKELINRLIQVIQDSAYYDGKEDSDGYSIVEFSYTPELEEIKQELMNRLK